MALLRELLGLPFVFIGYCLAELAASFVRLGAAIGDLPLDEPDDDF